MRTSAEGRKFLKQEEGEVLRAYRCPAGVWTIGCGLTAASGVVKPVAGMVITAAESDRLLGLALERNYEPAAAMAMRDQAGAQVTGPKQHEFDAAVSFHFNTGAILRASWVARWKARDWPGVRAALLAWNKGGGKVLPGLVRRRAREFRLLQDGVYDLGVPAPVRPDPPGDGAARLAAPVTGAEVPALHEALTVLGYVAAGESLTASGVRRFQDAHGLTVDGIVGRATASAIRRALDARRKGAVAATATGGAGVAAAVDLPDFGIPGLEAFPALAVAVWGLRVAVQYRDSVAAALHLSAPRLAQWLRSF